MARERRPHHLGLEREFSWLAGRSESKGDVDSSVGYGVESLGRAAGWAVVTADCRHPMLLPDRVSGVDDAISVGGLLASESDRGRSWARVRHDGRSASDPLGW